ncbi:head-tail adaptor protein [Paracoccus seriniphilus]|uniref:head-tail adaptor protein n=1 Tax=Paracoccus seriniphilus TaxID=184748 RepID=UPI0035666AF5
MTPGRIRLELEEAQRQDDGLGGYVVIWRRLGVLYGAMDSGSGRRRSAQVGPESVVSWRITVRGARAGDPRRPRAGQRFRLGQRLFRIDAVAEKDSAGRWLTCFATEEVQA